MSQSIASPPSPHVSKSTSDPPVPQPGQDNIESLPHAQAPDESTPKKRKMEDPDQNSESPKRARLDSQSQKRPDGRDKGKNTGRGKFFRAPADKRRPKSDARDGDAEAPQRPVYAAESFSLEEIASEDRRPKRKVAVLIGYSGTGYKGMQILPDQRTIEGDLFHAFVAAHAISKANANDPKKSQLVRCARTDKGVHAAGNLISLKLIIEDEDIVEKINSNLPPEIRVWGIQRTTGSFNCYGACDSRMYEYLIPTYCFLPPLPSSWLGKRLVDIATEDGKLEEYDEHQKDVAGFWEEAEAKYVRPVLEGLDPDTRELVEQAIYKMEDVNALLDDEPEPTEDNDDGQGEPVGSSEDASTDQSASAPEPSSKLAQVDPAQTEEPRNPELEAAIRSVKAAYIQAKKAYRISDARLQRVRDAFGAYEGTHNFHNFTVGKSSRDPSAKRYIMSFKPDAAPITIGGTEWLSLKVHGMSFMLHQIRKMVSMAAFVVRCAAPTARVREAMTAELFDVPKAPGLGLLLERPLFDAYNRKAVGLGRETIDFGRYEKEILAFKQRHIYDQIFRVEEEEHVFHTFFNQIDNFRSPTFLYFSSRGRAAAGPSKRSAVNAPVESFQSRNKYRAQVMEARRLNKGQGRDPVEDSPAKAVEQE